MATRRSDQFHPRVLVDGVEIRQVWYVNTDIGFVCTYDVFGDGSMHDRDNVFPIDAKKAMENMVGVHNDMWTQIIMGNVQLQPWQQDVA